MCIRDRDSTGSSSAAISGEINGGGSTSVQKIIEAAGDEFAAQNPDVKFTYSGTGSSDGIKGATEGTYAFGCASRELKDEEKSGLTELVFAYDGIAMITHPSNPVTNISSADLTKIYTGEITNWSQIGGNEDVYKRQGLNPSPGPGPYPGPPRPGAARRKACR